MGRAFTVRLLVLLREQLAIVCMTDLQHILDFRSRRNHAVKPTSINLVSVAVASRYLQLCGRYDLSAMS